MSVLQYIERRLRAFAREEDGTTLVEFALAIVIFLLLFLGSLDFGRFLAHYYHAERAMHIAARLAVVRPAVCPTVPELHDVGVVIPGDPTPRFGTKCSAGVCADVGTITCSGTTTSDTANEIWGIVGGAMPPGTNISNMRFSYAFDDDLGFLGGPYTPMVTVELTGVRFRFLTPLGKMGELVGGSSNAVLDDYADADGVPFPPMGVTMPGEDLALGTNG